MEMINTYKNRTTYFEAFRIGIDAVPQWFKDLCKMEHTSARITKDGFFIGNGKVAEIGDFVRKVRTGEVISAEWVAKDRFNDLYEPVEFYSGSPREEDKWFCADAEE